MTKSRIIAPSDSWSTNQEFYETLDRRFHFDPFDPCPMDCPDTFNGLTADWINPMQGLHRPKGITRNMPRLNRGGQFDSMVVAFRSKVRPRIIGWDWRNRLEVN